MYFVPQTSKPDYGPRRITDGMRSGWTTLRDATLPSTTSAPNLLEWPCKAQCWSGLTASAQVSDVSAPAYTNGVWPLLQFVNVAQKNKPLTILFFTVQSIDLRLWLCFVLV